VTGPYEILDQSMDFTYPADLYRIADLFHVPLPEGRMGRVCWSGIGELFSFADRRQIGNSRRGQLIRRRIT
jgi:hypothetical protein